MSVLNKVRRWIDGETAETVLEEAARDAQVKPRSINEEFIVKLAQSVEEVMQREMVPLPQGTTLIPTEYIIFLSNDDDKEWQGVKRKGLEQGLYHVLAERAKEISGKKKLETQSFAVELRVDGTLEKGEIRVQHGWEDSSSAGKTGVLARPKLPVPPQPRVANQVTPQPNVVPEMPQAHPVRPQPQHQPPPTVQQIDAGQYVPPTSEEGEIMTRVQSRMQELYKLEIWQNGVRQNVVPIYQREVAIGRGSKSKPVDIPLAGDPEVSRRHATLICDPTGGFYLINEGRNYSVVSSREVPMGQRMPVMPGEPIGICSYILRIQPR